MPPHATGRLRIAFLSYRSDPRVGGQGVYLAQAAAALARRGHEVVVLSGPPYPQLSSAVKLVKIPSLDLFAQPHGGKLSLRWRHLLSWTDTREYFGHLSGRFMEPETFGERVARYFAAHAGEFDVVLDNQTLAWGLLKIERLGLPVVGVVHHPTRRDLEIVLSNENNPFMRMLRRRWYSFLAMQEQVAPQLRSVVVVSSAAKNDVASYLRIPIDRMKVIPLGVDRTVFRLQPETARHKSRLVTTASADVPLKGLPYLIAAYADLLKQHPDLELVVVGRLRKGPTQRMLRRLNLLDRVQFVHDLSNEELARLYASATIYVAPSVYEGFGLPALEAMSCGTPVVVTQGGALPETVGQAGVVVPIKDSHALQASIARLLADGAELQAMSQRSLDRAAEFDWDRLGAEYEAVLRESMLTRPALHASQHTQA